jgi:hypothetical protein
MGISPQAGDQTRGRFASTSASSASTGWPSASVSARTAVSARTTSSCAGSMSATMSPGRYNTAGSCGPPCPDVRFSRSCPTTRSVPPGATASALDVDLQSHQSSGVAAELLLGEGGSPLQCHRAEVRRGGVPSAGRKPQGIAALSGRNIKGCAGCQIVSELLDPDIRCGGPDEVAVGITLVPCGLVGAVHVVSLRWGGEDDDAREFRASQ